MYTVCPPGCHHNGLMATPELGRTVTHCWIALWSHKSAQTASSERSIMPRTPNPESAQTL